MLTTTWGQQAPLTEYRSWDGLGRLRQLTDTKQRQTTYRYSKLDVLTSTTLRSDNAGPTRYMHDALGRTSSVWKNGVTLASYQRLPGGLVFAQSADGRGTRYVTYNASDDAVWSENSAGDVTVATELLTPNVATTSRIRQGGALTTGTIAYFDWLGRISSQKEVGGTLHRSVSFEYDAADNLALSRAADSTATIANYDLLGRIIDASQQANWGGSSFEMSRYSYNQQGLLESTIDPAGYETVQHYNGFGGPTQRTGPTSVPDAWTYDDLGRKVSHTVGGVVDLSYEYDSLGYLRTTYKGAQSGGIRVASYDWDSLGRLKVATNFNTAWQSLAENERTVITTRDYDDANRTYRESVKVGTAPEASVLTHFEIQNGLWTKSVELPNGHLQQHLFDQEGREANQVIDNGGTTTFKWLGELLTSTAPADGPQIDVTFDEFAQPSAWSSNAAITKLVRDRNGRIAAANTSFAGVNVSGNSWRGYGYDALGRIATLRESATGASGIAANLHPKDSASDMNAAADNVGADRFDYVREEKVGSLVRIEGIQKPRFLTNEVSTTPAGTPTARQQGYQLGQFDVGTDVGRTVTHDTSGRMTSDGHHQFIFDDNDELAYVTTAGKNGNLIEGYFYDYQGRLTARLDENSNIVEILLYDGVQMVSSLTATGDDRWQAEWGPGIDNLVSIRQNGADSFPIEDGRGSISGWVAKNVLLSFVEYTPEGRAKYTDLDTGSVCEEVDDVHCPKPFDIPFGFHSAYSSSATGLIYFRNRWYSPEATQWLTKDPLGFVDSFNEYAFNAFDSVNFFDPFGLEAKDTSGNKKLVSGDGQYLLSKVKTKFDTSIYELGLKYGTILDKAALAQGRAENYATRPGGGSGGMPSPASAVHQGASSGVLGGMQTMITGAMWQWPWSKPPEKPQPPKLSGNHVIIAGATSVHDPDHDESSYNFLNGAVNRAKSLHKKDPDAKITIIMYSPENLGYQKRSADENKGYKFEHEDVMTKRAADVGFQLVIIRKGSELSPLLNTAAKGQIQTLEYFGHSNANNFYLEYSSAKPGTSTDKWGYGDKQYKSVNKDIFAYDAEVNLYGCNLGTPGGLIEDLNSEWGTTTTGATDYTSYKTNVGNTWKPTVLNGGTYRTVK